MTAETKAAAQALANWFMAAQHVPASLAWAAALSTFDVAPASFAETTALAANHADGGHIHLHTHRDGTLHSHPHSHRAGKPPHGHGVLSHRHEHAQPAEVTAGLDQTGGRPESPQPQAKRLDARAPAVVLSAQAAVKDRELATSERLVVMASAHQRRIHGERRIKPGDIRNTFREAMELVSKPDYVPGQAAPRALSLAEARAAALQDPVRTAEVRQRFGEAATIPGTSVQATLPGRQDGNVLQTPTPPRPVWNQKLQRWESVPSEYDQDKARALGKPAQPAETSSPGVYSELKRQAQGLPPERTLTREQARNVAIRLGEHLAMSELAVQKVVKDNADVDAAAEAYRAERFTKFGEMVSHKEALRQVERRRR